MCAQVLHFQSQLFHCFPNHFPFWQISCLKFSWNVRWTEQKSIVVEDLSPVVMYALHKANLLPQPTTTTTTTPAHHDDDDDANDEHESDEAGDAEQVLLTDDDIKVMIDTYYTILYIHV